MALRKVYGAPLYEMGASDYIVTPGARLDVGPHGRLYETLGQDTEEETIKAQANADAAAAQAETDEAAAARRELERMKRSLESWLKYRQINDEVAAGKRKARVPAFLAAATLERDRDWAGEQKLADDLYMLLSRLYPADQLPTPDVSTDRDAAVRLAQIAISGKPMQETQTATGIWPIVILAIGGVVLFTLTSYISNRAEVQKEKERLACIQSGACTDYGFWLKAASVVVLGYFAWNTLGLGEKVKRLIGGKR